MFFALIFVVAATANPTLRLNADLLVPQSAAAAVDWEQVREDITQILKDYDPRHDDGSIAPVVLRLAWHSAATYDPDESPHGGTAGGATMRFLPESDYEDNRGLKLARDAMAAVRARHPEASHADVWVLASYVAIEAMEGPYIAFRPGRVDAKRGGDLCPPEDRLPLWDDPAAALRAKFGRMGLDDRDIVALSGAHSVGHTHDDASGFPYHQWDNSPLRFDNTYYDFLLANWWVFDEDDPTRVYYRNRSWIMLLSDFILREDDRFRPIVVEYSENELQWHIDFAAAFKKVTEVGIETEGLLDDLAVGR